MSAQGARSTSNGASLAEALVTLAVASLLLILALAFYEGARRSFREGENAAEQQQSARVALEIVEADLRLAGFQINPDGDPARPDEPIEAALATALVLRADFDASDAGSSSDPERALEGGAFERVSTGNDEIRGFVLRPMEGVGSEALAFDADVAPAPRDGAVERVTIDRLALTLDRPPYALYRVALDADAAAYGAAGFVRFTPVVENVRALRFRYFDRAGRELVGPGGEDTPAARETRAAIVRIGVELDVLTREPDPRWLDRTDGSPRTRRKHKLALASHVFLRNASTQRVRPRRTARRAARDDRGAVLVLVLCIVVAASLLALALTFVAEADNRIARNEKRASQARFAAEAGARLVKRWFDDPRSAPHVPAPSVVDRSLRRIRNESDPEGASLGSMPRYKEGIDSDGDGADDLFELPFDGSLEHALRGTLDGPDVRIDGAGGAEARFLEELSTALFAGFPGEGGGVRARISRIDISAPPYLRAGAGWIRQGVATVRVTARLVQSAGTASETLAERTVETVLAEVPYRSITGPLLSCADTVWTGRVGVRWGTLASVGRVVLSGAPALPSSVPRAVPPVASLDPVWNWVDPAAFAAFVGAVEGLPFPDPWFRVLAGQDLVGIGAAPGLAQPFPPDPAPRAPDRSNLFQRQSQVACPVLDYATWKAIAESGDRGVHLFAWDGGAFREDGTGPATTLPDAVRGGSGFYFFDTADGQPPRDDDGDGSADNLTPAIELDRDVLFRGVLYAHARSIRLVADPTPGSETTLRPPGEPFQDADLDGTFDLGEAHLDLVYPTAPGDAASPIPAGPPGGARDATGPPIPGVPVAFHGILFNRGRFEATGRGTVYGAVVAGEGVSQSPANGSATTPDIFWDASIPAHWPPPGWAVPRVLVRAVRFDP